MAKRKNSPGKKKLKGFYYTVTDEQIRQHQQRSMDEIFTWLETIHRFISELQSPQEKEIMNKIRAGKL